MRDHLNTGGVTILDITGEVTLRDKIWQAMDAGSTRILLNLAGISRLDSFGVGELVAGYASIVQAGGAMKLLSVSPQVKQVLEITRLCTVFEIYEDEASAVRSFSDAQLLRRAAAPGSEMFFG
jgi:anti-sigma B factor antagonist